MIQIPYGTAIRDAERVIIEKTIEHYKGDKSKSASVLGISMATLYNRLKVYEALDQKPARRVG